LGTQRWENTIKVSKTIPAADCRSDHELLIATTKVKLKRSKDHRQTRSKLDWEQIPEEYKHARGKGFKTLEVRNRDPDNLWEEIRRVITEAAMKNIPKKKETRKVPNGSQKEPLRLQKRREAKQVGNRAEVRRLKSKFQREARKDKERFIKEKCCDLEEKARKRGPGICSGQLETSLGSLSPKQVHSKAKMEN
jgi:hypothetical protein